MPKSSDLRRLREKLKALEEDDGEAPAPAAPPAGASTLNDLGSFDNVVPITPHGGQAFPLDEDQIDMWEKQVIEREGEMLQVERHNEGRERSLAAKLKWIQEQKVALVAELERVGASAQVLKSIVTPDEISTGRGMNDGPCSKLGSGAPQTWHVYGERADVVQRKRKHHELLQRIERLDRIAQQAKSLSLREASAVRNEQRIHMTTEGLQTLADLHTRQAREQEWVRIKTEQVEDIERKYTREKKWCTDTHKLLVISEQKAQAVRKGVPPNDVTVLPPMSSLPQPDPANVAIKSLPLPSAVHAAHPLSVPPPPDPASHKTLSVQDVCRMTMAHVEELCKCKVVLDARVEGLSGYLEQVKQIARDLTARQERVNRAYQDKVEDDEKRRNFSTNN
eukprot:TRINITY_DN17339_c0_g1_i1.p1 TRINITY_DN17339_c0_g1~~TRINITY_DN17339_c0_g1_i1.p1  ORF type:complete len:393 (+),score=124.61 TRINITY_DN17339_c0_g1_i1:118-1296(+)